MAGHSKWANTKRRKEAQDSKRGKIFSLLSKEITIAARSGADPDFNPRLRTLLSKAKTVNMPNENVQRAIKKGSHPNDGQIIEELTYEAYALDGVAMIIEATTDNKNRTATDIRTVLSKNGGNLASPGALNFIFKRVGQFLIDKNSVKEEDIMNIALDNNTEDIINQETHYELICSILEFDTLGLALDKAKISPESAEIVYLPSVEISIIEEAKAQKVLKIVDQLEALEDVKNVFHNMEICDTLIEKLGL